MPISRPVTWRKQTSDVVVDGFEIGKDRDLLGQVLDQTHVSSITFRISQLRCLLISVPLFGEIDDLGETLQSVLILDPTEKTGATDPCKCLCRWNYYQFRNF